MATYSTELIRQGLPRTLGGPAWPEVENAAGAAVPVAQAAPAVTPAVSAPAVPAPASTTPESAPAAEVAPAEPAAQAAASDAAATDAAATDVASTEPAAQPAAATAAVAASGAVPAAPAVPAAAMSEVTLRQGLPRVAGGAPWPAEGTVSVAATAATLAPAGGGRQATTPADAALADAAPVDVATAGTAPADALPAAEPKHAAPDVSAAAGAPAPAAAAATGAAAAFVTVTEDVTLRQGLPRVAGGPAWPEAATVSVERAVASLPAAEAPSAARAATSVVAPAATEVAAGETGASAAAAGAASTVDATPATPPVVEEALTPAAVTPEPAVTAAIAPEATSTAPAAMPATQPKPTPTPKPKRDPVMIGSRTLGQWVKLAVLWGGGAIVAAGIIVLAARGLTTLPGVPEFLQRYPGEYHLPEFVDPGFPAWARWSHFLNFFLIVLIIRSGLLVRKQQRPDAFFTPKKGGKKISIYLWLHTSLDLLWLLNGIVFVVLLFVTGHWARIVPTSWEVFPNALSAGIQYLTLEWPVEDGWVNYNSLQQLMYFTVVFIAAPLAAITGVRMSEWWPQNAERLNKLYPAPVARAIHYPVMLFFVLFIIVHVFLVFTTGALKNLNHMFAGTPEISWVGFWWFVAAVLVTAAVTWAARPLVLAPIASLFGRVSER